MKTRPRLELDRLLSSPRLGRYTGAVPNGDIGKALDLYEWNTLLSGAFHESICGLEVALRNTMSLRLERHHTARGLAGEWYDDPSGIFNPGSTKAIHVARSRIAAAGKRETSGRVVAELSFGFWRFLLTGKYQPTLWVPTLQHGFRRTKRKSLERDVARVHVLRNRIAHHEGIFDRDLEADYRALLQAAEAMSIRLAWWIDKHSRVPAVIERRP